LTLRLAARAICAAFFRFYLFTCAICERIIAKQFFARKEGMKSFSHAFSAIWLSCCLDPDTKLAFEEQLSSMPTNEVVYLLTAFANLAQSRRSDEEHLVKNISVDIFKVRNVF